MSNRRLSPTTKVLIKARQRIEDPENWCPEGQGRGGRDGHRVCALIALGSDPQDKALGVLRRALAQLHDPYKGIICVNAMGHAAVMALYDRAIWLSIQEANQQGD